ETLEVEIEKGKTLIIKLVSIGQVQKDGTRIVYFELNGQPREVAIKDFSVESDLVEKPKADQQNEFHVGAPMPGTVAKVLVEEGDTVKQGDHLVMTEAMKMETTIQAPVSGTVEKIYVEPGEAISQGDLLIELR